MCTMELSGSGNAACMFPLHCVVEAVPCIHCAGASFNDLSDGFGGSADANSSAIIVDSYAIIAGETRLSQLTDTVLSALGLSHLLGQTKGKIKVKNWKMLDFDQITDDPENTSVETLLKDLSSHVTLKILTKSSSLDTNLTVENSEAKWLKDLRSCFLKAAVMTNPTLIDSIEDPTVKNLAICLSHDQPLAGVNSNLVRRFAEWCKEATCVASATRLQNYSSASSTTSANASLLGGARSSQNANVVSVRRNNEFFKLSEVAKLERWFRECPKPPSSKLMQYLNMLNSSVYRKNADKISYQQLCNWFSNARAIQQQQQQKGSSQYIYSNVDSAAGIGNNKVYTKLLHNVKLDFNQLINSNRNVCEGGVVGVAEHAAHSSDDQRCSSSVSAIVVQEDSCDDASTTPTAEHSLSPFAINGMRLNNMVKRVSSPAGNNDRLEEEAASDSEQQLLIADGDLDHLGASFIKSEEDEMDESEQLSIPVSLSDEISNQAPNNMVGGGTSSSSLLAGGNGSIGGYRTRLMFDPLTEVPLLEQWFDDNPHPSWVQIDQFTEMLNCMSYRQACPPVSTYNVKIWFKNRRAKCKRLTSAQKLNADEMNDL